MSAQAVANQVQKKNSGAPSNRPHQVEFQQTLYQGPLPAPHDLFQYDQLLPGSADRIIAMAEREQAHRMNIEDQRCRADIRHRDEVVSGQRFNARGVFISDIFGQAAGAVVGLACVAGAVYVALQPGVHPTVPIALVGLPVASIIHAIRSRDSKQRDSKTKEK